MSNSNTTKINQTTMETDANPDVLKKILEDLRSSDLKVGEKFKKLNEFVNNARSLNFEGIKKLVNPVDFYSRRLCIYIACALKNLDYIVHLLKTAENSVLRTALKNNAWLYTKDSALTDPNFLLNDLFPVISFTSRQIILIKLPKHLNDEERCETIFEAVASKYGFEKTGDLIVGCSPAHILKVTQDNGIKLKTRQLKPLLRKHPKLVQEYLTLFYKSKHVQDKSSYNSFIPGIARSHPSIFMSILESSNQSESDLNLNAQVTRQVLRFGKSEIIANPSKYVKFIDKEEAYKQLPIDEYISLFASEFPAIAQELELKYRNAFESILFANWLGHIPRSTAKSDLLQKAFMTKYGVSLLEDVKCCSIDSVHKLLPAEIRTKISDAKILKKQAKGYPATGHVLASIVAFKPIDKSIPEIKELISREADINLRYELITSLLDTCVINDDKVALAEVFKYYVTRHRNERDHIHVKLLIRILELFNLSEFNSETWNALFGIIQLILLTKSDSKYYQTEFCQIIEHLYIFQTLNPAESASIKSNEVLLRLLKRKISGTMTKTKRPWLVQNIWKQGLSLKHFFGIVVKELESAYPDLKTKPGSTASDNMEQRITLLMSTFHNWNSKIRRRHQEQISVKDFPWLEEKVDEILDLSKHLYHLDEIIRLLISDPVLKKDEIALTKYLKICASPPLLIRFLRKNPNVVVENWETIETSLISGNSTSDSLKHLEFLKYHGYSELTKRLIEKCQLELQGEQEEAAVRCRPVVMLSILQNSSEFQDTVKDYLPETSTIDSTKEEGTKNILVRETIVWSLTNLEFPSEGLPLLLKCGSGYSRYFVKVLYPLCYTGGQDKVMNLLTEMTQNDTQVKKHVIRLTCQIGTLQVGRQLLKTLSETEKDEVLRHVMLKYLFKIATVSSFPAIKSIILTIRENQTNILHKLTDYRNIDRIPAEFLEEYFTIVLNVISSLSHILTQYVHVPKFLTAIEEFRKRLSTDYMTSFFQSNLYSSKQLPLDFQNTVTSQFVKYMLATISTNLVENLKILQNAFATFHSPNWDITKMENSVTTIKRNRKQLTYFVGTLTEALQSDLSDEKDIIALFQGILKLPTFEQHAVQTFEERLGLQVLLIIHVAKRNQDFETGGAELVELLDSYIQKYGKDILPLFNKILESRSIYLIRRESQQDFTRVNLITGILDAKTSNSKERNLLALQLLPRNPEEDIAGRPDIEVKFKRIVDVIFNSSDPHIQFYVYNWIKGYAKYGYRDNEDRNKLFHEVRG